MAESIDFEQSYHGTMFDRQFLQRLVQFFLKLFYKCSALGAALVAQQGKDLGGFVLFGDLFQAEKSAQAVFSQMGDSGVDRNPVQPGKEGGLPLEAIDGLKCLDKSVLRQVGGVLAVSGHIVDHGKKAL